jgi:hypothetical protein
MQINRVIFLIICLCPALVFANGETPVSDGLQYITNAMYGATGIAIATISMMVVGLLCYPFSQMGDIGLHHYWYLHDFWRRCIVSGITSLIHNF